MRMLIKLKLSFILIFPVFFSTPKVFGILCDFTVIEKTDMIVGELQSNFQGNLTVKITESNEEFECDDEK